MGEAQSSKRVIHIDIYIYNIIHIDRERERYQIFFQVLIVPPTQNW